MWRFRVTGTHIEHALITQFELYWRLWVASTIINVCKINYLYLRAVLGFRELGFRAQEQVSHGHQGIVWQNGGVVWRVAWVVVKRLRFQGLRT